MNNYPYSDNFMVYDFENHRYVLTEKDVEENLGINLASRSKNYKARERLLKQVSREIYAFIHEYTYSGCEPIKDYIIATTKSGREKIKEAMEQQFDYIMRVGEVSKSTDAEKRSFKIDSIAKSILEEYIPELGTNLLYTGYLRLPIDTSKEW